MPNFSRRSTLKKELPTLDAMGFQLTTPTPLFLSTLDAEKNRLTTLDAKIKWTMTLDAKPITPLLTR